MKNITKILLLLSLSTIFALSTTIQTKRKISSKYDDAEENIATGQMYLHSPGLDFVKDNGNEHLVGLRFKNIKVPKGVTITHAYLQFSSHEINSEPTSLTIHGEHYLPARKFKGKAGDISGRIQTTASVDWNNIPAWEQNRERGIKERSSDIAPIIQEIIDQDGWKKGKALVLILSGSGKRVAKSYNASHSHAPALIIEYDNNANPVNHMPLANAGDNQTLALEEGGTTVQLNGSGSSDPDGDALSYSWSFLSEPTGSTATLNDFTAVNPSFTANVEGDYTLQLIVNDGLLTGTPDTVTISITDNSSSPVPEALDPTAIPATIFD